MEFTLHCLPFIPGRRDTEFVHEPLDIEIDAEYFHGNSAFEKQENECACDKNPFYRNREDVPAAARTTISGMASSDRSLNRVAR